MWGQIAGAGGPSLPREGGSPRLPAGGTRRGVWLWVQRPPPGGQAGEDTESHDGDGPSLHVESESRAIC